MLIEKTFRFEASHQIYNHPGKCARLHGHSWVLKVAVEGQINKTTGMVLDYSSIKSVVQPIVDRLDHQHLGYGEVQALDESNDNTIGKVTLFSSVKNFSLNLPTSENLCVWIADQLPYDFPWAYVSIDETCTSSSLLTHEEWLRVSKKPYERRETSNGSEETKQEEEGAERQVAA